MASAEFEQSVEPQVPWYRFKKASLTRKQKVLLLLLLIVTLQPVLLLLGMWTGMLGYVPVSGNSMCSTFEWGTWVIVVPAKLYFGSLNGRYVIAYTWGGPDGATEEADKQDGFVLKKYQKGRTVAGLVKPDRLFSTDSTTVYTGRFVVRGVVIGQLPIQRLIPSLGKLSSSRGDSRVHKAYSPEEHRKALAPEKARIALKYTQGKIKPSKTNAAEVFDDDTITTWAGKEPIKFSTTQSIVRVVTKTMHPNVSIGRIRLVDELGHAYYSGKAQGDSEIVFDHAMKPGNWTAVGEDCAIAELELYSK